MTIIEFYNILKKFPWKMSDYKILNSNGEEIKNIKILDDKKTIILES